MRLSSALVTEVQTSSNPKTAPANNLRSMISFFFDRIYQISEDLSFALARIPSEGNARPKCGIRECKCCARRCEPHRTWQLVGPTRDRASRESHVEFRVGCAL